MLKEFSQLKLGIREYLQRYHMGHYNPRDNFFCAMALKDKLVDVLDPKPLPYRDSDGVLK